jgi:hypothetical protein
MTEKNGLTKLVIDKMRNIFYFTYIIFLYTYFLPTTPTKKISPLYKWIKTNSIYINQTARVRNI